MQRVVVGVGVLSAVAGFLLGRLSVSPGPPAPAPPQVTATPTPSAAPSRPAPAPPVGDCETRLATALGVIAAAERARVGTPIPFPEDLPAQLRPDAYEREVRAAVAECGATGMSVARVDCAEFPCMAWFAQPDGGMNHAVEGLVACPGWQRRFPATSGTANGILMTDAGPREYGMLTGRPAGGSFDENASLRFQARFDEGQAELEAQWDARPLTRREQLEHSLAAFQDVEGAEQMLELLRQELAALPPDAE